MVLSGGTQKYSVSAESSNEEIVTRRKSNEPSCETDRYLVNCEREF